MKIPRVSTKAAVGMTAAVVASQALSSLAWTTTSSSTKTAMPSIGISGGTSPHLVQRYHAGPSLSPTLLLAAKDDGESSDKSRKDSGGTSRQDEDTDEARRMALVRSLQMSFYSTPAHVSLDDGSVSWDMLPPSQLDPHTGAIQRLPLWRSGWSEVPGRSNVLHVHDPVYTNMFEKMIYGAGSDGSNLPRYFGHLYLPQGSKNLSRDAPEPYQLKTWRAESQSEHASNIDRSAVLGCLMKIADFRRLADGRLLLLVHATERFVVTNVHQELPYSVADVQILPDREEQTFVAGRLDASRLDETVLRALTVQESIRHHEFEYDDDHALPVPASASGIAASDIVGTKLRRVLPFVPFSSTKSVPSVEDMDVTLLGSREPEHSSNVAVHDAEPLESKLLDGHILYEPRPHPELIHYNGIGNGDKDECDDLEYRLWLALNDLLISDRIAVSPVLLGLIPKHVQWPSNFALQTINHGLGDILGKLKSGKMTTVSSSKTKSGGGSFASSKPPSFLPKNNFVTMPKEYPKHRRQRRLSFAAAHLLEKEMFDFDEKIVLRQSLLAAPSTAARLRLVLERFELQRSCGEFE